VYSSMALIGEWTGYNTSAESLGILFGLLMLQTAK